MSFNYNHKNNKKIPTAWWGILPGNVLDLRIITMLADEVLNFWVRDGTRCDHFSKVTGSLKELPSFKTK